MTAFLIAYMAPIMFAALVVILLLGYPAAFSLGAVGLISPSSASNLASSVRTSCKRFQSVSTA